MQIFHKEWVSVLLWEFVMICKYQIFLNNQTVLSVTLYEFKNVFEKKKKTWLIITSKNYCMLNLKYGNCVCTTEVLANSSCNKNMGDHEKLRVDTKTCVSVRIHVRWLHVYISVAVFFQLVWAGRVVWDGESGVGWGEVWDGVRWGGYKGETNSSLGDEGKHNYVQFSS